MADKHLSQLSTAWTLLRQAHGGSEDEIKSARRELLQRYGTPVYRYLMAAVRNADAADELYQEFALHFVRGGFRHADASRGRFRDYLKSSLYHLVAQYRKRQSRGAEPLAGQDPAAAPIASGLEDSDQAFLAAWRAELLERAWSALQQMDRESGQMDYAVLRLRADHPDMPSPQMAQQLSNQLQKEITSGWIRKRLHVAREKFTKALVAELRLTLDEPSEDELQEELLELGLLDYCGRAIGAKPFN